MYLKLHFRMYKGDSIFLILIYIPTPPCSSFVQEVLVVYLKPSFPVEGLKGVLHRPGTAVLLKDALCQKMEGAYIHCTCTCIICTYRTHSNYSNGQK